MCKGNCSHSEDFMVRFPHLEAWHDMLTDVARRHDVSVSDVDAWAEGFELLQEPEECFYAEYPEYRPSSKDNSSVIVGTPCKECPWKRASAQGWLGSHTPGNFLALSDQGAHLPCHLHVNYDEKDWEEKAAKAPQCAGHAIFLANRCKRPTGYQLAGSPDHQLVFTRPHEFVAHHLRVEPETLEATLVWDLYKM